MVAGCMSIILTPSPAVAQVRRDRPIRAGWIGNAGGSGIQQLVKLCGACALSISRVNGPTRMPRGLSARARSLLAALPFVLQPCAASADYSAAASAIERGDLRAAREACAQAADAGDPDCENVLGWLSLQDPQFGGPETARQWFERAADRGHQRATANLAFMWARGLGGPADVERAAELYRSSRHVVPTAAQPPDPVRLEPAPQPAGDRLAIARYRGAYAELLKLRALHALREGETERYVIASELEEAEAALSRLAEGVERNDGDPEGLRAAVEKEQRIMLRLLSRDDGSFDPTRRTHALETLRRVTRATDE